VYKATWRLALVILLVAACNEPPDATDLFDIQESVEVECSSVDDWLEELPGAYTLVLGVVAVPGSENSPNALQVTEEDEDNGWQGTKSGLIIPNGGEGFTLSIPQEVRDRLFIWGWGTGVFKYEIEIPGCERTESYIDDWLIFGGGFSIRDPECVPLIVSDGSSEERIMVGVGSPCPGQGPPPSIDALTSADVPISDGFRYARLSTRTG
jgi:hypothetical protein